VWLHVVADEIGRRFQATHQGDDAVGDDFFLCEAIPFDFSFYEGVDEAWAGFLPLILDCPERQGRHLGRLGSRYTRRAGRSFGPVEEEGHTLAFTGRTGREAVPRG